MKSNQICFLAWLFLTSVAHSATKLDFSILKKQMDESGIYEKRAFEKVKKCVSLATQTVDRESIGGISLETKVSDIEKITKCKLDPKNISKNEQGLSTWDFKECDLVVIFKDQNPLSVIVGSKSKLKLKSGIGMGSKLDAAKKSYSKINLHEGARETVISTPVCEVPDPCGFDHPSLSIRGNTYDNVVTQFEINRYSAGYCAH